jgi:uncharacterized protein YoaH (UPF0181 family)
MSETPKPPPDYHPYEPWIDYVVRVSCSGVSVGEAIQLLAATELAALRAERDRLREAIATFINIASECPRHTLGVGGQTVESCLRRTVVSRLPWCSVLELEGALYLPDDNPADKP